MSRHVAPGGANVLLLGLCLGLVSAGCQDVDGVRVEALTFVGNTAFSSAQLAEVFITRASGPFPWSRPRTFDKPVYDADLARLAAFYISRGYPDVVISDVVEFSDALDAVRLRVVVDEGQPMVVEQIELEGLETMDSAVRAPLATLPLVPGGPRDETLIAATIERIDYVLRDNGYARARTTRREREGSAPNRTVVTFDVAPGVATSFGEITVNGLRQVDERIVRRSLTFRTDEPYRESRILETQRRLAGLGLFDFAHVGEQPDRGPDAEPSTAPIVVTVTEAQPTQLQFGLGYGTEDGPRGSLEWQHLNFLGGARQLTAESKYSARLRGAGVRFAQPWVGRAALSLSGDAGGWWTNEPAYSSRAFGGQVAATMRAQTGRGPEVEPFERTARLTYLNKTLQYTIDEAALDEPTVFEELIALGLDPISGRGSGRLAALDLDLALAAVDRQLDPRSGYVLSLHLGHAASWLGGTFRYDEVGGEARAYVPVGDSAAWAGRVHGAALLAEDDTHVPFSERYFLGGSSTLRGWGRYQVSPLTRDGLPIGGRALFELSSEMRFPLRGSLSGVVFVDAGNVWTEPSAVEVADLRLAVGPGVRWSTPFGIVRADLGIQVNRIRGLVIDGAPERRRWRVHFNFGHAF